MTQKLIEETFHPPPEIKPHDYFEFFSGGGLVRLGLGDGWKCVGAVDNDPRKDRGLRRDTKTLRTPKWVSFRRTGSEKIGQPEKVSDSVDRLVWQGAAVTAFTSSAERYLPRSVVSAADHRIIIIGPPKRSTLRFLFRCLFGRSCFGPVTKDSQLP